MFVERQGYVSKIRKTGHFIVSLQVKNEGVKMTIPGYEVCSFPGCNAAGTRNHMKRGDILGAWYCPDHIDKQEKYPGLFQDIREHLVQQRRSNYAKKEAF